MKSRFLISILLAAGALCSPAQQFDYIKGVFIVNEDWYGHQNSTINYLLPDDPQGEFWHYRVFQSENPGKELGCTNQYGAIWKGRFYLIAKQEKDPGASITGGRITVADAKTMKMVKQHELIDPSGAQCDGRGFLGVDVHKGYISSSNGVWVFDLNALEVTKQIPGTGNPNIGDGRPNTDPGSSLYFGQCGSMVMSHGKVFVAHQSAGILVVDPTTDTVVATLTFKEITEKAQVGSVVLSKDGRVWASVAKDATGAGNTEPWIVEINPSSLEMTYHRLPDGIEAPSNSWYAWTPDGFCSSNVRNALYWNGGNRWFAKSKIYRYDIDTDTYHKIIDLDEQGDGWNLYGCSMRLHPLTDELYMSLFIKFVNTTYRLRRCDYMGNTLQEYPMIANYWFPSLPVFPENENESTVQDIHVDDSNTQALYYNIYGHYLGTDITKLPKGVIIKKQEGVVTKFINR